MYSSTKGERFRQCQESKAFSGSEKENVYHQKKGRSMKVLKEELGMANDAQGQYFEVTDKIPEGIWYWASLVSIIGSMVLFFARKRQESLFVGQWAPTFLLFGLFHKDRKSVV